MPKLRAMVVDAEAGSGPVWAMPEDPRVTPVGRLLRKLGLDELPQLPCVLKGEMSLIGPRLGRPEFVDRLSDEVSLYRARLLVRPGITGWAQVNRGSDQSVEDVIEKLRYDLYYIRRASPAQGSTRGATARAAVAVQMQDAIGEGLQEAAVWSAIGSEPAAHG